MANFKLQSAPHVFLDVRSAINAVSEFEAGNFVDLSYKIEGRYTDQSDCVYVVKVTGVYEPAETSFLAPK